MRVRHDASPSEIRALGDALRALRRDARDTFDALFDPGSPRRPIDVATIAPPTVGLLRTFGLVDGAALLVGEHRIRAIGERLYLMELGEGAEYLQDVWPETDALLEALAQAAPGRLADVGTGSGVVAIEAAARGHAVVATDLYDTALALARFNASLNGVALDLRRGHLFEPLADEPFDLVLTAPHYGREFDQLRLEVLHRGPASLAAGGRLVLATALEWEGDGPLAIEPLLRDLAGRGFSTEIAPIVSERKRGWHRRAVGAAAGIASRARFTVAVARDGRGRLSVERHAAAALPERVHVPLARLAQARGEVAATVTTAEDVAALASIVRALDGPVLRIEGALPSLLVDACRFGGRPCVAERGQAAGAILDGDGGVRPCHHGRPLARATDSLAALVAAQRLASAQAAAHRGCDACPARTVCSRCLFPAPFLDEAAYCAFVREEASRLPRLHRLVEVLARRAARDDAAPTTIRSLTRALPTERPSPAAPLPDRLAFAWRDRDAWLVEREGEHTLSLLVDGALVEAALEPLVALVAVALLDGASPPLPARVADRARARLAELLLAA